MKKLLLIISLLLFLQTVYGQACGIYRIKYVGTIINNDFEILKVKLPSIPFLHGLEKKKSKNAFFEVQLNHNKIELETMSHLTSFLSDDPKTYLNRYENEMKKLPIIFIVKAKKKEKEVVVWLLWKDIKMIKIQDKGIGNLFEINLKEIGINPHK